MADDTARADVTLHEFVRVGRLVPDDQVVESVEAGTAVRDALETMRRLGFDQLPVVAAGRVIGVFSFRSLAANLSHVRAQDDPLTGQVEDFLEDLDFVRPNAELTSLLDSFQRDGAVIIGDEERLVAVATSTDLAAFLWTAAQPFLLVQDIELATRSLMTKAVADEDELTRCLAAAKVGEHATSFDQLTMGEMLTVLTTGENFGRIFRRSFGAQREMVRALLEPVRDIRNKVVHFRGDVTLEELEQLVKARLWVSRKVQLAL